MLPGQLNWWNFYLPASSSIWTWLLCKFRTALFGWVHINGISNGKRFLDQPCRFCAFLEMARPMSSIVTSGKHGLTIGWRTKPIPFWLVMWPHPICTVTSTWSKSIKVIQTLTYQRRSHPFPFHHSLCHRHCRLRRKHWHCPFTCWIVFGSHRHTFTIHDSRTFTPLRCPTSLSASTRMDRFCTLPGTL